MNKITPTKSDVNVYVTTNYDIFKFTKINRPINQNHVEKIQASMMEDCYLNVEPIKVNSDFEVLDGQHRLLAARNIGETIYYIIDNNYDATRMSKMNSIKLNWSADDYVNHWAARGNVEYQKLKECMDRLGVKVGLFNVITSIGSGRTYAMIKNGTYMFDLTKDAIERMEYVKLIHDILRQKVDNKSELRKLIVSKSFLIALRKLFCSEYVNKEKLASQIKKTPLQIRIRASWTEYLKMLVEIYNYNSRSGRLFLNLDKDKVEISS